MKNAKLVISIVTLALALLVMLQSCAAGLGNAIEENGEAGGSAGLLLAICFIVSGVLAVVTRKTHGGATYAAAGFYIAGGLIGLMLAGSYSDLYVWSAISIVFGIVFIVFNITARRKEK